MKKNKLSKFCKKLSNNYEKARINLKKKLNKTEFD